MIASVRSSASRRRLVEAMGLGPSWVLRTVPLAPGADETSADDGRASRIAQLSSDALPDDVARCVACGLCRSRTQTVPGSGAQQPAWFVIGSGPGAEDDLRGDAFAGPGGKLLDAMLAAVGLARGRNVFVTHVVKCRAPDGRDPSPDEAARCRPYLERQVALLAPRMILTLGEATGRLVIGTDRPLAALRGRHHMLSIAGREIPVVATEHPDRLTQAGEEKARAWADLCLAREVLSETVPPLT